ncbi:translation initiation factor IF-2 [Streptomyces sp. NBC_00059]|uniref:translation initiation factor IF-2 n=1 Tax=Streptomyces sp. NBC_00059 TaxID=2975635 RepID=UPI00224CA479|nr:translation initiation factor IF-2 [Streptomyces sp. NBC_00059]MCX5415104.1 translation initiation factor IF-2 [Streptomyces sp. NBC_00059]
MRRLLLLGPLLVLTVGCGVVQSSEGEATDMARDAAREAGRLLHSQRPRTAEEVGRSASGIDGVEVMRLTGTSTHEGDGVDVVVRTEGSAYNEWFDVDEITVRRCFSVRVSPTSEWDEEPSDVSCPAGLPLTFAPAPEPPALPYEQLRAKLPRVPEGGRADEAEVRRALTALDLHPEIRSEVRTGEGGSVGVLLSVQGNGFDPQDCLLARVAPGATKVWVPSRVQRMPGEGGCTIANALDPLPAPH